MMGEYLLYLDGRLVGGIYDDRLLLKPTPGALQMGLPADIPYEGAKPRSVPIDREGWQELQVKLGIASEDDFALAAGMNEDYGGEGSTDE